MLVETSIENRLIPGNCQYLPIFMVQFKNELGLNIAQHLSSFLCTVESETPKYLAKWGNIKSAISLQHFHLDLNNMVSAYSTLRVTLKFSSRSITRHLDI